MRGLLVVATLNTFGCATAIDADVDFIAVPPSRSTAVAEIEDAIAELIRSYPVCHTLRAMRFIDRAPINFDTRSRESPSELEVEETLDALVGLGYLTKSVRSDLGPKMIQFDRTELGKNTEALSDRGFCFPADRKLIAVTKIERLAKVGEERYLVVDFTHIEDPTSVWAREPRLRGVAGGRGLSPEPVVGRAMLSRVWIRNEHPLRGAPHSGRLWAVSYDPVHNRWEGGKWGSLTLWSWGLNPH